MGKRKRHERGSAKAEQAFTDWVTTLAGRPVTPAREHWFRSADRRPDFFVIADGERRVVAIAEVKATPWREPPSLKEVERRVSDHAAQLLGYLDSELTLERGGAGVKVRLEDCDVYAAVIYPHLEDAELRGRVEEALAERGLSVVWLEPDDPQARAWEAMIGSEVS